ncbi:MAG TPA: hypothetical protein VJT85_00095 [Gemmatimonadaceae bacterium]|nr:hypothetical protein [Gemmatimonadaceae bacterium]
MKRCTIEGCNTHAGEPPHLKDGQPICARHAVDLAGGKCAWCGEPFEREYGACGAYPSKEGKAYCIDCWQSEGYGYPMRAKAE